MNTCERNGVVLSHGSKSQRPSFKPSLILLDCDGTLTDSHQIIVQALQQAFQACALHKPSDEDVCDIIGLSLSQAIDRLAATEDQILKGQLIQAYGRYYRQAESDICLFPHVRQTLETLRARGYWLGVVTGKSMSGLQRVLERFAMRELFYVLRTADCTFSKPHPAMVLECMAELGVTAGQTCVVGDAVFDVQMARAAKVDVLGVSFGVASSEALLQAGAMQVIDDFAALLEYFPALQDAPLSPTMSNV